MEGETAPCVNPYLGVGTREKMYNLLLLNQFFLI